MAPTAESSEIVKKINKKKLELLEYGILAEGVSPETDPDNPPVWFDKKSFEYAQQLYLIHEPIISLTSLYGLLLGLNSEHILLTLLSSGKSTTVDRLFLRYISTVKNVNIWYKYDPFDPKSKAYRSLRLVRMTHRSVAEKLNKNPNDIKNKLKDPNRNPNQIFMSQCDMVETQFAFIGLCAIFPNELGFRLLNDKDFHALFHFWRVIGYCLGIDDRFNLFSGTDEESKEYCRQLFDRKLPSIKKFNHRNRMNRAVLDGLGESRFMFSFNAMMRYAATFMGFDPEQYPLETFRDRFDFSLMNFTYNFLTTEWINYLKWNRFISRANVELTKRAYKKQDKYKRILQRKYSDIKFDDYESCFFPDEI